MVFIGVCLECFSNKTFFSIFEEYPWSNITSSISFLRYVSNSNTCDSYTDTSPLDIYTSFCDIFYNDVNIGSLCLNQDSGYCESIIIYTDSLNEIGDISINKCNPNAIEAIVSYFNDNFSYNLNPEHFWKDDENYEHYVFQFLDGDDLFVLSFVRNEEMIEMISISLRNNMSHE